MKLTWINREKTVFLGTFVALALAGSYALVSKPEFQDTGSQRVRQSAPGKMLVSLQVSRPGEMAEYLSGARPNPFAAYVPPRIIAHVPPEIPIRPPVRPPRIDAPPPPPPIGPPPTVKPPTPVSTTPSAPKPYEVPVNFRAVVRTDDGRHFVVLETKKDFENRYLHEGDIWPETGLTIKKITLTSVLLENEKGERFLMRDLYTKKARPDGTDGGAGRS
jgi:hypothetical protein